MYGEKKTFHLFGGISGQIVIHASCKNYAKVFVWVPSIFGIHSIDLGMIDLGAIRQIDGPEHILSFFYWASLDSILPSMIKEKQFKKRMGQVIQKYVVLAERN